VHVLNGLEPSPFITGSNPLRKVVSREGVNKTNVRITKLCCRTPVSDTIPYYVGWSTPLCSRLVIELKRQAASQSTH
jgi:hypothetical protein